MLDGMAILLAALLLSVGGMSLVFYSAWMTREAISKRVDLIRGKPAAAARAMVTQAPLIRAHPRGAAERELREVERLAAKVGIATAQAGTVFIAMRLAVVALFGVAGYELANHSSMLSASRMMPLLLATALGILGWFFPAMFIGRMIKARTKAVVAGLPDALELLVICVEAGLAFEDGLSRVVGELQKSRPVLAEEMAFTAADLKILPNREQALANLAERIEAPSVRSMVTTLTQTLRYGTPLAQALRMVASELRNDTLIHLEERANQLPTLMTIPMMLFIMPTIFLIVAGPAALRVMDVMK
jgi:tight adherence protein C